MVEKSDNLAGIKDIIEPDAILTTQQSSVWIAVLVLFVAFAFLYLINRWNSPIYSARRRYNTLVKHQNKWPADVIGEQLMRILSQVPHEDTSCSYHQARELCNRLRFSGEAQQADTIHQALQSTHRFLWPVN